MPATLTARPGTGRLSEVAKYLVRPSGIVSTGWGPVRRRCEALGVGFDPWQDGAGRLILAKRADGRYAATVGGVGVSEIGRASCRERVERSAVGVSWRTETEGVGGA